MFDNEFVKEYIVVLILFCVFVVGFCIDVIGVYFIFGVFLFGFVIFKEGFFVVVLVEKLEDFVFIFLLFFYFVLSGLKINIGVIYSV